MTRGFLHDFAFLDFADLLELLGAVSILPGADAVLNDESVPELSKDMTEDLFW